MNMPVEVRTPRMGHLFLCAVVILGLLGCDRGSSSGEVSQSTGGESGAGPTQSEADDAPAVTLTTAPEAASIYTAVLRQAIVDAWAGRGEPGFKVVLVVDGVVPHASKPTRSEDPRHPFAADLKEVCGFWANAQGCLPSSSSLCGNLRSVDQALGGTLPG